MRSIILGPPGLIMLAALLGAIGAFWAAIHQSELRKKGEGNAAKQLDLLQDIAARGGNQKELEELIRTRSRALNLDHEKAHDIAEGIIKRLPALTAEFRALEQNKLDAYERSADDFRIKWQPLIQFALNRFDSLTDQCQKRGVALQRLPVPFTEFPFTANNPGQRGSYKIREVKLGNTNFHVEYESFIIVPNSGYMNGQLHFNLAGKASLLLSFGKDGGYCQLSMSPMPDVNSGEVTIPKDGSPPTPLLKFFDDGLAKIFERFVVMGNATVEPSPTPPSRQ